MTQNKANEESKDDGPTSDSKTDNEKEASLETMYWQLIDNGSVLDEMYSVIIKSKSYFTATTDEQIELANRWALTNGKLPIPWSYWQRFLRLIGYSTDKSFTPLLYRLKAQLESTRRKSRKIVESVLNEDDSESILEQITNPFTVMNKEIKRINKETKEIIHELTGIEFIDNKNDDASKDKDDETKKAKTNEKDEKDERNTMEHCS